MAVEVLRFDCCFTGWVVNGCVGVLRGGDQGGLLGPRLTASLGTIVYILLSSACLYFTLTNSSLVPMRASGYSDITRASRQPH